MRKLALFSALVAVVLAAVAAVAVAGGGPKRLPTSGTVWDRTMKGSRKVSQGLVRAK